MNWTIFWLGLCFYPLALIANAAGFPIAFRALFIAFLLMGLVNLILIGRFVYKKNKDAYRLLKSERKNGPGQN
jgi:membrane protein implicated in regulation of membrane protease activity